MTKNPTTGEIWTHEHGPQGGDEINIIKKAANYGWPVITYGIDYDGSTISNSLKKKGWNSLCIIGRHRLLQAE